jgi:predicted phosphodiesterase
LLILLLSDVHANLEALETVLDSAPACDELWNLGDLVGYGASPNEVVEILAKRQKVAVRGNHDKAVCSNTRLKQDFNPIAYEALQWTRHELITANVLRLSELLQGPVYPNEEICCAHGSPLDENQYLLTRREAWHPLNESLTRISLVGHTHLQGGYVLDGQLCGTLQPDYKKRRGVESIQLQMEPGKRYVLNPGSVGQPRDGDWRAAYAVLDTTTLTLTWHRVPYDIAAAQKKILAVGLPKRLAQRLEYGM